MMNLALLPVRTRKICKGGNYSNVSIQYSIVFKISANTDNFHFPDFNTIPQCFKLLPIQYKSFWAKPKYTYCYTMARHLTESAYNTDHYTDVSATEKILYILLLLKPNISSVVQDYGQMDVLPV